MNGEQGEMFRIAWQPRRFPFRLRVNDLVRVDDRIGIVIRVTECAAVILINRRTRDFKTRFDKPVRFQPPPITLRISANADTEILNRKVERKRRNRKPA
jgi:hypothetical protein